MRRRLRALPVVAVAIAATASAALAAPAGSPSLDGVASDARTAAEQAMAGDLWMATLEQIEEYQTVIDANVEVHTTAADLAEDALEVAEETVATANTDLDNAVVVHSDLETLLQAFVINTFVLSNGDITTDPEESVALTRRDEPIESLTSDVLADVATASETVDHRRQSLNDATTERDAAQLIADDWGQLVRQAENLADDFAVLVEARDEEMATRTQAALDANETPDLVNVEGFIVNVSIEHNLAALLAAAREDGIEFGGWGHREVMQQIVLRESHCGTSGYAIFDMPSGQCSPPTARPGHSEHELGLAVDFTENGAILNRSSPGFAWLVEHAADYGLRNLPSEPWHWSTTGH